MIEFQYFEGCPNAAETLRNLEELSEEGLFLKSDLKITNVQGMDRVEELHFQGSPTVLVDGIDIVTGKAPEGFKYTCRIYTVDGNRTGFFQKHFRGRVSSDHDREDGCPTPFERMTNPAERI
ncbi:MAG: thioredoxin family protein [Rhodopseudomonas palustris]|nr:thioredoxin family protein [Rhodopseudomonas palustris]